MCMDEAVQVEMPNALRRLFATILIFSCPNNPAEFWDKYYRPLSEDFRKKFPEEHAKVLQLTAGKVAQFLEGMGKTFSQFGLNHLHFEQETILQSTRDISDVLNAPVPLLQLASRKQLNLQQRTAYKAIIQHVQTAKAGAFFHRWSRSMGQICLPTATSGIAASNLPTGRTTHSRFKIPLDTEESLTCDVPKQRGLACLIREASLVIWDEASNAKRKNIEAVNMLFQDVCNSSQLFGGKVIVFGGDFRQVLPVLPRRTQQEAVEASIVSSPIWPHLTRFSLTENIRAREDPQFSKFLLDLGNGNLQTEERSWVSLPQELILQTKEGEEPEETLINVVFPEMKHNAFSPEIFNDRAILTPRNADVDSVNSMLIEMFPGTPHIYHSFDSVVDDNSNVYPTEFLNSLCPAGMTPHELILKEDSRVILLRNLDPAAGLCNGTRLICKRFFPNMIECEISTGFYKGECVLLPRITLKPSKNSRFPINF
ncbi:ATP-dependent DNA helicase PIF1-like [Silene latifolia]|uniref:ATP-dependent DNA helicase PIF1-like n=1 Tax=Silene latifolia TaxID=37657 RepID=UPI003D76DA48